MNTALATQDRIDGRLRQNILSELLIAAQLRSGIVHADFVTQVKEIALMLSNRFRNAGLVNQITESGQSFWRGRRGSTLQFTDGGVAGINIPSSAPLGIRVGNYTVRLGDTTEERERFDFAVQVVDDLFDEQPAVYEDHFEDTGKLRDAARIICEIGAVLRGLQNSDAVTAAFLHGPLVNPVAPYGLQDFPAFRKTFATKMLGREAREDELNFIPLYSAALTMLREYPAMVVGVVERSKGAAPGVLTSAGLAELREAGELSRNAQMELLDRCRRYGITDVLLFSAILDIGEYAFVESVSKQGPSNKWPAEWEREIRAFPAPLVGYIKTTETQEPLRFEAFPNRHSVSEIAAYVHFMSRLLPEYSFPVGLDIADKFAKVPAWMTRQISKQHALLLLRSALESGDPKAVELAKRTLSTKGRDWLFRPKA